MKRAILLLVLLLLPAGLNAAPAPAAPIASPPAAPASAPVPGTLRWKNGESLSGNIVAASASDVTWASPLFEDPLQLRWDAINRMDFPSSSVQPTAPFSVALRDGSFIYGDLASITADSISIHSTRHGNALLKRSEVLNVRRLKHGNLLYSGPVGDLGWDAMSTQQDGSVTKNQPQPDITPPLSTGPGGALQILTWNRSASLDLTLPDRTDIEFRVRSSKRPQFSLAFGANIREAVRVETWDDELVLTYSNQFQAIRKIEENEREVALRICWDKKEQKYSVYGPTGDLITTWQLATTIAATAPPPPAPVQPAQRANAVLQRRMNDGRVVTNLPINHPAPASPPGTNPGLVLQNRGLDLSLDFLRVRNWDGKAPAKLDPKQPHVELADGRSLSGKISGGTTGSINVQASGQAAGFPIADVDALIFSSDPPQPSTHEATLIYNDGTLLLGKIASIANERASVATSFTKEPLSSQLDLLQRLVIHIPEPTGPTQAPPEDQDKIVIDQTTLHGKFTTANDSFAYWMPVGGLKASRPSLSHPSEITRFFPPDALPAGDPALFYLSTGDVLPGSLKSMDRSGAEFESSIMDARKLPADELDAIEFAPPTRVNVQSFSDPSWKILKGDTKSVRIAGNKIEMDPGSSLSSPSLMQCSEVSFKMSAPNGFASARLQMFCAGTDATHSMNLLMALSGNQFVAGMESGNGQFDNQNQIMVKQGDPVTVRLEIGENSIDLFADDMSVTQIPIEPEKCSGSGLIIGPTSVWGNSVFPVALSDFSAHSSPGNVWLPEVTAEVKKQVLTLPRFEKDDAPKHLLLAANGDVLRGEIEAATDSHFGFRCGLENLNVPRDRVRAVIWLKPPDPNAPAAPVAPPPGNPLNAMIQMRMGFGPSELQSYIGFITSQFPNLKFKLPETEVSQIARRIAAGGPQRVQMQIGGQTVGAALDAICARFNLSYHLDDSGMVVIESKDQPTNGDIALKSYWLKPDAIPKTPPVQEILTGKGLTFPKDSSVKWDPSSGLLAMTNTADNQTKLAALVNSDFGGSQGSPTHWLLLTSGARLALAVDKFADDFITGHNPAYGSIKIPMTQVYIIRTSAPDLTVASRALKNWRLVNAPEPVLPEGSSEISSLLGKQASTFSLPLLEGGNFDLAAQKGQIVVLDFWASWCGPCIKSLPGLIDTIATFPADRVKLIGVNQGETPEQVKKFMQTRGLKFAVAMDADQGVGQKYGVDAIPHTVIVGPDGKVAWTQTGYSPDGDSEASDAVKQLLKSDSPADPPAPKPTQ